MPPSPWQIGSLHMRRDSKDTSAFYGHKFPTEIFMSNCPQDPTKGYCRLWGANRGSDFTAVMKKKDIEYPALGPISSPPAPFSVSFVLDSPFMYKGKAFLIEFDVHPSSGGISHWYADAEEVPGWIGDPTGGSRVNKGVGCPPDFTNYGLYPFIGNQWHHFGYSRVKYKSLAALNLIGVSSSSFGGLPLPFDLKALGGENCSLYTDILFAVPSFTEATSRDGRVDFHLGTIPNDLNFVGAVYTEQQIVLDTGFNGLGLRMSRLATCTVGGPFVGSLDLFQFFDFGNGFSLKQQWARYYAPKGLVLELRH